MLQIATCPSCGSPSIKWMRQDWTDEFRGQTYLVPDLEFYQCSDCGERLYDREAMRKIEACSPAFTQARRRTRDSVAADV